MASLLNQPPPLTHQLLGNNNDLASLLPASVRTKDHELKIHSLSPDTHDNCGTNAREQVDIHSWIDQELDVDRLDEIHDLLWLAGRPIPPRPLCQQRQLNREIVVTEDMGLHLVWSTGRICIKPLPRFLLDSHFWTRFLSRHTVSVYNSSPCSCGCDRRRKRALGFLFSYAALISHESDFHIAKERYLIPSEVQWSAWTTAMREVLGVSHIYPCIDRRFYYGELRLNRLDKIYFYWKTPFIRYTTRWNHYRSFVNDNFAWLASSTVYIAVVLTAMQVGLSTHALAESRTFQSASYGFTVCSILGPLAVLCAIVVIFCYLFITNWVNARSFRDERFKLIYSNS